jgi:hypothetical protein
MVAWVVILLVSPMEEEDDLPFSTGELQSNDDPQMNKGGYMRGYAEAGLVTDPYTVGSGIMQMDTHMVDLGDH